LISAGANINAIDDCGWTPIMEVYYNKYYDKYENENENENENILRFLES
jgi:hypothetical protein